MDIAPTAHSRKSNQKTIGRQTSGKTIRKTCRKTIRKTSGKLSEKLVGKLIGKTSWKTTCSWKIIERNSGKPSRNTIIHVVLI